MAIFLVRHGSTQYNEQGNERLRAWADVPLDKNGIEQAHDAAEYLSRHNIAGIVTSDLQRAHLTGQIIGQATGTQVSTSSELRPWNMGVFTGKPIEDVKPWLKHYQDLPNEQVPGGESYNEFFQRWSGALNKVLPLAKTNMDSSYVYVVHARNINATDNILSGGNEPIQIADRVPPGGIYTIRYGVGGFRAEPIVVEQGDSHGNKTVNSSYQAGS